MIAFLRKEVIELIRSGRMMVLLLLFVLFGIMNPAVAKLMPWLLEIMADSLAEGGMTITLGEVSAMDSWVQFFKNIPMALIILVLLESSIFTREYSSGTLVLSLTKGLARYKVTCSKSLVLIALWTVGFWLCFGITYAYNAYFWDNSVAENLFAAVAFYWLFGLFVLSLLVLFSTLATTNTAVLLGTGGVILAFSLLGFFPRLATYLPTYLGGGAALLYGTAEAGEYLAAAGITVAATLAFFLVSIPIFNKKQL